MEVSYRRTLEGRILLIHFFTILFVLRIAYGLKEVKYVTRLSIQKLMSVIYL